MGVISRVGVFGQATSTVNKIPKINSNYLDGFTIWIFRKLAGFQSSKQELIQHDHHPLVATNWLQLGRKWTSLLLTNFRILWWKSWIVQFILYKIKEDHLLCQCLYVSGLVSNEFKNYDEQVKVICEIMEHVKTMWLSAPMKEYDILFFIIVSILHCKYMCVMFFKILKFMEL